MADARPRWHDTHVVEALLRPFQEVVALLVARELQLHVLRERAGAASRVRDDRVVDHQIAGDLRVDLRRIAAQLGARLAHDCEVHEHRHAREVLEQHTRRRELHLAAHLARVACRPRAALAREGRLPPVPSRLPLVLARRRRRYLPSAPCARHASHGTDNLHVTARMGGAVYRAPAFPMPSSQGQQGRREKRRIENRQKIRGGEG